MLRTPLVRLNVDDGPAEIWLKLENLQPIGAFKIRGAGNAMAQADPAQLARGVYTASAGNMAQGVAWHARRLGIPATSVVPDTAPQAKLDAIARLGADYVKEPFDVWWRVMIERRYEPLADRLFIHPFADPKVMAGNGTIGLEILEDLPDADAVVVPYGGGGLITGIASAVKAVRPGSACTPARLRPPPRWPPPWRAGRPTPVDYTPSFVDGIGSKGVMEEMWPLVQAPGRGLAGGDPGGDRRGRPAAGRAQPRRGRGRRSGSRGRGPGGEGRAAARSWRSSPAATSTPRSWPRSCPAGFPEARWRSVQPRAEPAEHEAMQAIVREDAKVSVEARAAQRFDPVEVLERCLGRIRAADPVINAFRMVDETGARSAAGSLRDVAPERRGPLFGMPVAVKDLFDVAGLPTTAGSKILDGNLATADAPLVARLRQVGAVVLGKTNMHEFAFGTTGINPHHGDVRNPRATDRIAGGSSSGSAAAVAAGCCPVALGTDTGGSIRIPAALCGVAGFKPSYGVLPMRGVVPLARSLDHAGYLARTVRQLATVHAAVASVRPDPARPLRIGIVADWLEQSSPDVQMGLQAFLGKLRTRTVHRFVELHLELDEPAYAGSTAIMLAEAASFHMRWLKTRLADYGADVRARLLQGTQLPATGYLRALQIQRWAQRRVAQAFKDVDLLVGPTTPVVAPTFEEALRPGTSRDLVRFTRLANLTGIPAVSLPAPVDGLPVGVQLMAARGRDGLLLAAALEAERAMA